MNNEEMKRNVVYKEYGLKGIPIGNAAAVDSLVEDYIKQQDELFKTRILIENIKNALKGE